MSVNTFESATLEMDVILYQENGAWIAQGLQYDITASGKSPAEASDRFDFKVTAEVIISLEVGDDSPLSGIGAAPNKFWKMFQNAKLNVESEQPPIVRVDGARSTNVRSRKKIGEPIAA